ncbi:DUF4251 domain-containing protein [Dysgonomonas sp. 216]|uniref:DUF4251 domain-containing protein n=1 Tax=Dysgonomonas sp. 216 TaxID=2302934 RepID=UPI0013D34FFA|nr:DUF4251 domain-containing protein [Dysgonomonas sp. 216]
MKKPILILFIACIASLLLLQGCKSKELSVADIAKQAKFDENIQNRTYTFVAQSALPMGFPAVNLSPGYTVKVDGDDIDVYLPYYGRAYSAPINTTDGGLKFVRKADEYTMTKKKDKFEITIVTSDKTMGETKLYLTIGKSGYANLNVREVNRQPISFSGIVEIGDE